jgi:hypothetical protein
VRLLEVNWKSTRCDSCLESSAVGSARSNWRRWGLLICVVALLLSWVFRVQVLTAAAAPLIFEDPLDFPGAAVVLHGSKAFYDEAAALYQNGIARQILVIKKPPTRSEQLGASVSGELTAKRLATCGVLDRALVEVPCKDRRTWTFATALRQWLLEHPTDRLVLICNRFESRRARWILDQVLAKEDRNRVRVRALADPLFDESDWWKRKEGQVDLFNSYIALVYSYLNGDSGPSGPDWTPREYVGLLDLRK